MLALGKISDRIIAGIGSKLLAGRGVQVARGAEVQLLGPAFFGIEAGEEQHHERSELGALIFAD